MSKKDKAQGLVDAFVEDSYDVETDAIAKKNLHLSMKLSGLLSMLDAYHTEYHQNKREIVKIANKMVMAKAESTAHKKHISHKTKNQFNKLDNQQQAVDKFVKRFASEFGALFSDTTLADELIDTFENYWSDTVTIDDKTVTIKTK